MFLAQLLLALTTDSLPLELEAWVPTRMATTHAVAVGASLVSGRGGWVWYHGVENVLTRSPAGEGTAWPVRAFSSPASSVASPHSRLGVALRPGLIVLGVWAALGWVLLIPLSVLFRQGWRFGRWHEILAVTLAMPVTWVFLRRAAGPVMASYFTSLAAALLLIPVGFAAIAWRKSRTAAIAMVTVAALATWKAEHLPVPLPASFDGGPASGATLGDLQRAVLGALRADSLGRTRIGFSLEGNRWIAHDRSRGAGALLVLLPSRNMGVIAVSNSGETTGLLEEIVDSIAR